MSRLPIALLLLSLLAAGCASAGQAVAKLEPGMPKEKILAALGPPDDRSFRGKDEAWQYQEIAGFGQCKYTTVWIRDAKVIGLSTRRGQSIAGCGLGSH